MVQISEKLGSFPEVYRRPNGRKWSGHDLHDAIASAVSRSYITNLRKSRVENPSVSQLIALAGVLALHGATTNAILHESIRLPERRWKLILSIIWHCDDLCGASDGR